jgi:anti-sigma regulatory factor (Ser/Thr protein kinase)
MRISLEMEPVSVRVARDATRRWFREQGHASAEPAAALVVSELVANSILHACAPIALHLRERSDAVRLGVSDGSTAVACNEPSEPGATSGRGMQIIESACTRWGSEVDGTGKLTWADIPTTPERRTR